MNTLQTEILNSIDRIDQITLESQFDICVKLFEYYEKGYRIMEYCDDNTNLDDFAIFQEGFMSNVLDKVDDKLRPKQGESIFKKALLIIPRLLNKLIQLIRKKFAEHKLNKTIQNVEKTINVFTELYDDLFTESTIYTQEAFKEKKDRTSTTLLDKTDEEKLKIKQSVLNIVKQCASRTTDIQSYILQFEIFDDFINNFKANFENIKQTIVKDYEKMTPNEMETLNKYINNIVGEADYVWRVIEKVTVPDEVSIGVSKVGSNKEETIKFLKKFVRMLKGVPTHIKDVIKKAGDIVDIYTDALQNLSDKEMNYDFEKTLSESKSKIGKLCSLLPKIFKVVQYATVGFDNAMTGIDQSLDALIFILT